MKDAITIYEAKTNFSKLARRAEAGETIYVGAYGVPKFVIAPIPQHDPSRIKVGIWKDKAIKDAYKLDDILETDSETMQSIEVNLV